MPRVLLIEDQLKLRRNLQQVLEQEGYEVVASGTGEEGYDHAATQPFDAIVLDLTLPGRDGLEILSDLWCRARTEHCSEHCVVARRPGRNGKHSW